MYISGGFNVYPAEVEQALARLDGVADVAVIGVPDERLGEVGLAVVVRNGERRRRCGRLAFCRERLANFKVPRRVEFVDALPRNPSGKVLKTTLREEFMSMSDEVLYEVRGSTAVVTMNRPEYRNAQNSVMTYALDRAFQRAVDDDEVKVIVLAGAGKHFSAGHDIGTPGRDVDVHYDNTAIIWWDHVGREGGDLRYAREMEVYLGMCRRWREIPKPMIAMIQGACIAGGLMLAFVCDLIVASDDAFFGDPVVRMGIPGVEYFAHPWVIGSRAAKEILFTGDRFSAQRAYEWGMVNRVVARDDLETETFAIAERIARDAAVRARADQARGQPVRGRDGHAQRHGLGVRAAPLRARAQRRGRRRLARRHGREVDEGDELLDGSRSRRRHRSRSATRCASSCARTCGRLPSMDTAEGFAAHREWEHTLADARLSVVSWPAELGGRDATLQQWVVFEEEYFRANAPLRVSQNGIFLLAPTLFAHATPEQLARIMPPMARADEIWAQAWSEPEAGSDLAGHQVARRAHRRRLAALGTEDVVDARDLRRPRLRACSAPTRTPSGIAG